jgi:23S rRNA (cytidine1920-2'-O)/16S rRNA (cytidine1409-2'-O)-methyltransferase
MPKIRLDVCMVEQGLSVSRSLAQKLIMAGQVRVNGELASKPSDFVAVDDKITIDKGPRFVSRGGEKLEAALLAFGITDLHGWVCADLGASTGGFTDCMLQLGAQKVYAIDVGYGILDWKIRNDSRVVVMEKTNARFVEFLPEKINLVTIDASFISLKVLFPVIRNWLQPNGNVVALIKPQFEAGRKDAAKGSGVIRDILVHRRVLTEILEFVEKENFQIKGLIQSPITGPKGNVEFLVHLEIPFKEPNDISKRVMELLPEG